MEPQDLKTNFTEQLEKLNTEIGQLRQALAQRQELALKLQGAIEAMQLQLGEEPGEASEPDAVAEATAEVPDAEPVEATAGWYQLRYKEKSGRERSLPAFFSL